MTTVLSPGICLIWSFSYCGNTPCLVNDVLQLDWVIKIEKFSKVESQTTSCNVLVEAQPILLVETPSVRIDRIHLSSGDCVPDSSQAFHS